MTDVVHALPAVALAQGSMPLLGFGTWPLSDAEVGAALDVALQTGYRHLDTATLYRNETGIGRALASAGPAANAGRERRALEQSLARLGRDHVDLWRIHWPPDGRAAPEVWAELVRARQDGLARAIGVTPEVNQIRWGPLLYDPQEVAGLAVRGVVHEAYSPLKASNLSDPRLVEIAQGHDVSAAQVVIAWHLAHGFMVIPKSARPERIADNAAAVLLPLTADEVAGVDALASA